jgi:hypothetical protein
MSFSSNSVFLILTLGLITISGSSQAASSDPDNILQAEGQKYAVEVSFGVHSEEGLDDYQPAFFSKNGYQFFFLGDFTPTNFDLTRTTILGPTLQSFKDTMDKLAGKIKPGDKIVISFDVHGSQQKEDAEHYIGLAGNSSLTVSALKQNISKLESMGAQILIFDGSCYSAPTLSLASDNVCVISGSGPNEPASARFVSQFWISAQDNAESSYLQARRLEQFGELGSYDPQISTNTYKSVASIGGETAIQNLLQNVDSQNFKQFFLNKESADSIIGGPDFSNFVAGMGVVLSTTPNDPDILNIQGVLSQYYSTASSKVASPEFSSELQSIIEINSSLVTIDQILTTDFATSIQTDANTLAALPPGPQRYNLQLQIDTSKMARDKQVALINSNAAYKQYFLDHTTFGMMSSEEKRSQALAPIEKTERRLFDRMYKNLLKQDHSESNKACSKFTF